MSRTVICRPSALALVLIADADIPSIGAARLALAGALRYNEYTVMKIIRIVANTLPLLVLGCKSAQAQPPPPSKTLSDGGYTWNIGAATMNGTNVPLGGIKVRAITNEVPK
jgi:hypothetical protein